MSELLIKWILLIIIITVVGYVILKVVSSIINFIQDNLKNIKFFLISWVIILFINQIAIFGACFMPYCLLAALPHTFILAALLSYFVNKYKKEEDPEIVEENISELNKKIFDTTQYHKEATKRQIQADKAYKEALERVENL